MVLYEDIEEVPFSDPGSDQVETETLDYSENFERLEEQIEEIKDMITDLTEEETDEETEEVTTEEVTEEILEDNGLKVLGSGSGDFTLYFSDKVENASLNDIYSMMVSVRNILLLFFLIWSIYKVIGIFRNVLYKLMNR